MGCCNEKLQWDVAMRCCNEMLQWDVAMRCCNEMLQRNETLTQKNVLLFQLFHTWPQTQTPVVKKTNEINK